MKNPEAVCSYIVNWLSDYANQSNVSGYVIGISGGIDSAVTSTLCALTGKKVLAVTMPIRQTNAEFNRANEHNNWLVKHFPNVSIQTVDLTSTFESFEKIIGQSLENHLAMANSRSRLRMTTLYALGQTHQLLVAGTGNKVEDFGVGFFTKYGDGGVDVSPIADVMKTEVFTLAKELNIVASIQEAKPTDGLWEDGRSDEDQIGATYPELEWAMEFEGNEDNCTTREQEVLAIYRRLNRANQHKINPIPVCILPKSLG